MFQADVQEAHAEDRIGKLDSRRVRMAWTHMPTFTHDAIMSRNGSLNACENIRRDAATEELSISCLATATRA